MQRSGLTRTLGETLGRLVGTRQSPGPSTLRNASGRRAAAAFAANLSFRHIELLAAAGAAETATAAAAAPAASSAAAADAKLPAPFRGSGRGVGSRSGSTTKKRAAGEESPAARCHSRLARVLRISYPRPRSRT